MGLNVLNLLRPAAFVHPEGFLAAMGGDLVEAGLDEGQARAGADGFEPELDQGRLFLRVVDVRIDPVGMPGEGETPGRLDRDHLGLPGHVFVARMGDLAPRLLADSERRLEGDLEPGPKLPVVADGAPDALNGRVQVDGLLDAVGHDGNLRVAYS